MSFFSWCQIVRFIMLVPNCPGAKLSGAKLSVFIMLVPNCPVPNCPTTSWYVQISWHSPTLEIIQGERGLGCREAAPYHAGIFCWWPWPEVVLQVLLINNQHTAMRRLRKDLCTIQKHFMWSFRTTNIIFRFTYFRIPT